MTIDFDDEEQFQKFVERVAYAIVLTPDISDELERDIADEIMWHHCEKIAEDILDKLIERATKLKED